MYSMRGFTLFWLSELGIRTVWFLEESKHRESNEEDQYFVESINSEIGYFCSQQTEDDGLGVLWVPRGEHDFRRKRFSPRGPQSSLDNLARELPHRFHISSALKSSLGSIIPLSSDKNSPKLSKTLQVFSFVSIRHYESLYFSQFIREH